jgi:G3E family GTPase
MSRTPTNLLTGFLGVGKTTAILQLLRQKPAHEKWAVLVNEYGEVGIDGAILEGGSPEGVLVREVGGGCFCCTTAPYLPVALHFLFVDTKPDRLLIETSGLGHPAGIVDFLRANYSDRLELRATIGIVAPADFACDGMTENPVFRDQVQMADVLVLNKADVATPDLVRQFQHWANGLFPPKLLIAATQQGRLDPAWLDLTRRSERLVQLPSAEHHPDAESDLALRQAETRHAEPGQPVRYATPGGVRSACGWIFHPNDVFDEDQLLALFARYPQIDRLKGVFRIEHEWIVVNRSGTGVSVGATSYRRDSRIEVFADDLPGGWETLEAGLVSCYLRRPEPIRPST